MKLDLHGTVSAAVLNRYGGDAAGGWRLPDLAYEGESWALIRLTVPKAHAGAGDGSTVTLGTVAIACLDLDGRRHDLPAVAVSLPSRPPSRRSPKTRWWTRRVGELEAANIQDRAQRAACAGDWAEVRRLLAEARKNAGTNEWLRRVVSKLERLAEQSDEATFSKEVLYASRKMRTRLAAMDESLRAESRGAPSYLRRKAEQGNGSPDDDDTVR